MRNSVVSISNGIIQEDVRAIAESLSRQFAVLAGGTIVVTGGSGFLCSYVLDTLAYLNDNLLSPRCRVISVDNLRSGIANRIAHLAQRPDFRFINHDVSQPLDFGEPVQWVIHGAGIASPTFYRRYPLETIDVNVTGTRRLLEMSRNAQTRSFVYFSTSEIYGDPDPRFIPTNEDYRGFVSCTGPRACYDESKRLAETLCAIFHSQFQVPVKVIRPFNVYGPGQRLDDCRIIPDLMSAALQGRPLVLFSDGRATRSFCYIRDAVRAMFLVLLSNENGEAFNVGNDEKEMSIDELAHALAQIAGPPPLEVTHRNSSDPQYLTDNPQRRCPDLTKLRTRLGWSPEVGIQEGLRRTLRSYQEYA